MSNTVTEQGSTTDAPQWNVSVKRQRVSIGSGSSMDEGSRRRLIGKLTLYILWKLFCFYV